MSVSPIYYVNSPVSGTHYYSKMWAGVVSSGENLRVDVWAYSGANGTGSLVTVTTLTASIWDQTSNSDLSDSSGNFNHAWATIGSTTSGHWIKCSGLWSGAQSVGSLAFQITYTTSTPFIPTTPSFSPSTGGPGTSVAITGSRFTDATFVNFNGVLASFTVNSDTSITATVPNGAATGAVTVGNPAGSTNSASNFTVAQMYVNTGTPGSPVWTAGVVYINTGTPASPVWTPAAQVAANTGTPASPIWTPGG